MGTFPDVEPVDEDATHPSARPMQTLQVLVAVPCFSDYDKT